MLKELQEKRIEHELNEIREYSQINPVKIKKISKEEYLFEFSIKKNEIQTVDAFTDVMFEIHMIPNFPITPPRVYCKTPFSFPHICDGRDILLDVLGTTWVSQTSIIEIISKLPTFVAEFLKNLAQGELMLVGQYYLGERYDLNFFNSLPICKI